MKTLFLANKSSYGAEFFNESKTLDELKKAIVRHEHRHTDYTDKFYTEELFKEVSDDYKLYEVNLHDDECIEWDEYDGSSHFSIEKKDRNILSTSTRIKD